MIYVYRLIQSLMSGLLRRFLPVVTLVLALLSCQKSDDYYVCAYVWPSCHNDPLAQKYIWPEGRGEWEVISKGDPRWEGHYQPRRPMWGYELDNDPEMDKYRSGARSEYIHL